MFALGSDDQNTNITRGANSMFLFGCVVQVGFRIDSLGKMKKNHLQLKST